MNLITYQILKTNIATGCKPTIYVTGQKHTTKQSSSTSNIFTIELVDTPWDLNTSITTSTPAPTKPWITRVRPEIQQAQETQESIKKITVINIQSIKFAQSLTRPTKPPPSTYYWDETRTKNQTTYIKHHLQQQQIYEHETILQLLHRDVLILNSYHQFKLHTKSDKGHTITLERTRRSLNSIPPGGMTLITENMAITHILQINDIQIQSRTRKPAKWMKKMWTSDLEPCKADNDNLNILYKNQPRLIQDDELLKQVNLGHIQSKPSNFQTNQFWNDTIKLPNWIMALWIQFWIAARQTTSHGLTIQRELFHHKTGTTTSYCSKMKTLTKPHHQ